MWWSATALAQAIQLDQGPTLLQPCLDEPTCVGYFSPQLTEALDEAGYALQHEPIATSAFGSAGSGVFTEVGVSTVPLGRPNSIQGLYQTLPAVPRLAVGGTLDLAPAIVAVGLHGLPAIHVAGGSTRAIGLSASGAAKLVRGIVRPGAELDWTHGSFDVAVIESSGELRSIEAIKPYVPKGVECAEPCLDHLDQQAFSARAGVGVVPIEEVWAFLKVGVTSQVQRYTFALDGSVWKVNPVMPELSLGMGTRLGGRWQLGAALATAFRPASTYTTKSAMTRLAVSTAFRFGP
jgi:hypothetical protein